ncbi:MAG: hypothetical protein IT308_03960 [Anaerolineaceae bacterium]|nr:hypothetical protein [Anaerolineaceae bacterium]
MAALEVGLTCLMGVRLPTPPGFQALDHEAGKDVLYNPAAAPNKDTVFSIEDMVFLWHDWQLKEVGTLGA